ncbi:hypothetical protein [Haliangium ochraceum]|uniref:DUF1565 domain-containing protein n=1 Tax=Haliangium ochraceum (strain DSM 14365 / JCM 11303 / SMP-2) TaxID=502025 RepID=D0LUQ6_HALO1|nr:hypothetical protein [Haliangium ochraceum]ACY13946.1 hypothetical protein Hoch_1392 [Haliangium ochraceum DSM 14365]
MSRYPKFLSRMIPILALPLWAHCSEPLSPPGTLEHELHTDPAAGELAPSATTNAWPHITAVSSAPQRIDRGMSTTLSVTVDDADGDALSYSWSDSGDGACDGEFDDPTLPSPVWTASMSQPALRKCALHVEISDGVGGVSVGRIEIPVGASDTDTFDPYIVATFHSQLGDPSAAPDSIVELEVVAADPDGDPIEFTWANNGGSFVAQDDDNTVSTVSWLMPYLCDQSATATVTLGSGAGPAEIGAFATHLFALDIDMPLGEIDIPDARGIDADCDGIDGDLERAYFVSPSGSDSGTGDIGDPFATVQYGLDQAALAPERSQVLVAAGNYPEALVLPDGVGVYAGYDADFNRDTSLTTVIDAPSTIAVTARAVTTTSAIEGFEIRSQDAPNGSSSIAVAVQDVTGAVYVRNNHLIAGAGGDGQSGASGTTGGAGGAGGNGGWPWAGGYGGAPGSGCSGYGAPGSGGSPGGPYQGSPGAPGGTGADGALPAEQSRGLLEPSTLAWQALNGGTGGQGGCGTGGGGGGSSLCGVWPWIAASGGGGGGGGGAGGLGGGGGAGAGGSFGVLAVNAGASIIENNYVETVGGGSGGSSGAWADGGYGGAGGYGFACGPGSGGNGGYGGSGGRGGDGTGGGGGMSVGVLHSDSPELLISENTMTLGAAGVGGTAANESLTGEDGIQAEEYAW